MLILTRKIGETIQIGNDVEVVVLQVARGKVKLGFAGPRSVPVRRGEPKSSLRPPEHAEVAESACDSTARTPPAPTSATRNSKAAPKPVTAPLHVFRTASG